MNWRPISLVNALYKIVAKDLANRMQPHVHLWIRPLQTGFVKNRCILGTVLLAYETIEWTLENDQDVVLVLLDFETAYDMISWKFLHKTLAALGFLEV